MKQTHNIHVNSIKRQNTYGYKYDYINVSEIFMSPICNVDDANVLHYKIYIFIGASKGMYHRSDCCVELNRGSKNRENENLSRSLLGRQLFIFVNCNFFYFDYALLFTFSFSGSIYEGICYY